MKVTSAIPVVSERRTNTLPPSAPISLCTTGSLSPSPSMSTDDGASPGLPNTKTASGTVSAKSKYTNHLAWLGRNSASDSRPLPFQSPDTGMSPVWPTVNVKSAPPGEFELRAYSVLLLGR